MKLNKRQSLVLISVVFISSMFVVVPWLTRALGPTPGYAVIFGVYWFCFCLPLGWYFQGRKRGSEVLSLEVGRERWVPWAVALQVGVIAVASWYLMPETVVAQAVVLAVLCGIVNGFCEEFYWRGAFLEQGRGDVPYQALGVILFTLWHVPLTLAHGVTYTGGAPALLGGALVLGAFWSAIAFRTGRIGWPIVAHVLTNVIAFVRLVSVNFV